MARSVALPTVANAMSGGMSSVLTVAPPLSVVDWVGGMVGRWSHGLPRWGVGSKGRAGVLACRHVGMLARWRDRSCGVVATLVEGQPPSWRAADDRAVGVAAEVTGRTARNRWHPWLVGRSVRLCMNKRRRGISKRKTTPVFTHGKYRRWGSRSFNPNQLNVLVMCCSAVNGLLSAPLTVSAVSAH